MYEDGMEKGISYTNWHLVDFLNKTAVNNGELTWKELAKVITNYTWIASDGNLVSMKRKITRTKRYLKNRILTESKIRKLTGKKFKKRNEQIKLTFVMEIDEQLGKAAQLWHYNKKADAAGISDKERMEYFVDKASKKAEKYFKLFQ